MSPIQRVYCVLHALRRHRGDGIDAKGRYEFKVCIVFYMHRGVRIDSMEGHKFNISIVFYMNSGDIEVMEFIPLLSVGFR